jgi:hypothetical protein
MTKINEKYLAAKAKRKASQAKVSANAMAYLVMWRRYQWRKAKISACEISKSNSRERSAI